MNEEPVTGRMALVPHLNWPPAQSSQLPGWGQESPHPRAFLPQSSAQGMCKRVDPGGGP